MNFQQLYFVIFMFYLTFSEINSWCFHVPDISNENHRTFACEKSLDFSSDLKKANLEKNISGIAFTYSNISQIENDTFSKFGSGLKTISITRCKLRSIEDGGFQGVSEIETLVLTGNLLETIKAIWFEGFSKLRTLKLNGNRISRIENEVRVFLPELRYFDLSENQLHCLPENFLNFLNNLQFFNCRQNPWHYKCCYEIMEWALLKTELDFRPHYKDVQHIHNITRECLQNNSVSPNTHLVDTCVEKKLNEMMENKLIYYIT